MWFVSVPHATSVRSARKLGGTGSARGRRFMRYADLELYILCEFPHHNQRHDPSLMWWNGPATSGI